MKIIGRIVFLLAVFFALPHFVAPAAAQATRTWVSGVGDDANPCSRTSPCKTFAGAISKTAAGGEISVLDPGGFGAVTITKSISIVADGDLGGILAAGTNGIIVNAGATDVINLSGIEIHGASKTGSPGLSGVKVIAAGRVNILDCFIHDFSNAAIEVVPTAIAAKVAVDRTQITNVAFGVLAKPTGSVGAFASLTRSSVRGASTAGVKADGAAARVVVSETVIDGATTDFVVANSGSTVSFGNNTVTNSGAGTISIVGALR